MQAEVIVGASFLSFSNFLITSNFTVSSSLISLMCFQLWGAHCIKQNFNVKRNTLFMVHFCKTPRGAVTGRQGSNTATLLAVCAEARGRSNWVQ